MARESVRSNLYLRTQLVKNGCTDCDEKYLNRSMDSHRLTMSSGSIGQWHSKKNCINLTSP
jgi:hypothetical protein